MQFLTFVLKEFRHIFRDRRTMLILLGMPIVQIILFGFALSSEVKGVRVAVTAPDGDQVVEQIIQRIDANEHFNVTHVVDAPGLAEGLFRSNQADLVVLFSERFGEELVSTGEASVELIADASDPNQAALFTGYAGQIFQAYLAEQQPFAAAPLQIRPAVKMLYNPGMKSAYNFVPGVMGLILMLICAMMTSIAIVREKESGTMEVLLVSPMRPIKIILAKAVPYLTLSCVNLTTILLLSVFVLGVPVAGSLGLLTALSTLYIMVSLALGLLISTLATTQIMAMLLSGMVLLMPTMILSGLVFPIESMPGLLRGISNIIPAKWYIMAVRKVMIEGLGAGAIVRELSILAAMAVVLIGVSVKKFKTRLE